MNMFLSYDRRSQEVNLKQFEIRKKAKLCICLIEFIQILCRLSAIIWDSSLTPKAALMTKISIPFCALMIVIIYLEYLLFKKRGPDMAKYSNLVDIALLLVFLGDWISFLLSSLYRIQPGHPPSFQVSAIYGFTSFSWRTLMITLLVQKWQLKIIAPAVATLIFTGYTVYYCHQELVFALVRMADQIFNIILIVYCEDKVKWKLMRTNIEQEKWMQVNSFILDSIPENIMILDLAGEARFTSEYCKSFLRRHNLSLDAKDFFDKVRDLQQQYEADVLTINTLHIERFITSSNRDSSENMLKVETLQDLISSFPGLIQSKSLQERQFLVYNGKFKAEAHQKDKSIEMKISFVQHYKNNYMILIFRDTTQRDLVVTLQETNKYKDQLLSSVSHELRAPLNGNINLVEGALNNTKTPEDIKENFLTSALRSSKFLLHIINDIIDMSQIKQKKLRLVFQSEDLKETLSNTAQLVELQVKKKGLEFLVELDPTIPRKFYTDHLRVSQVVLNLLSNAVKFTNQGMIKLIAMSVNNTVQISIEDSGIGISQENMKKLFYSNTNTIINPAERREKMKPTGAGIGLCISKNLVELLAPFEHKNISVVSTLNQGSIFTFVLENKALDQSHESTEELAPVALPKIFEKTRTLTSFCFLSSEMQKLDSEPLIKHCSCPKVLIVDDNPFNTMALETILGSLGIKSDSAYNGASGLQKLLNRQANTCGKNCKPYSVVFMDQEMPGMSGAETVREIKKLQEENRLSSEMRIIGCTAHKVKEEVDRFLASGLEDCIFKPVSIGMIRETLSEVLD